MKITNDVVCNGNLMPYQGKISDKLQKEYRFFTNILTDRPFNKKILPGPREFVLVSFRCDIEAREALEVVNDELHGKYSQKTGRAIGLPGKKLVFGKLRDLLGGVRIFHPQMKCLAYHREFFPLFKHSDSVLSPGDQFLTKKGFTSITLAPHLINHGSGDDIIPTINLEAIGHSVFELSMIKANQVVLFVESV